MFIIFLVNFVLVPNNFCMSDDLYSAEDSSFIKSFVNFEYEKFLMTQYIESNIFPKLDLVKKYLLLIGEEEKVDFLVFLLKRKRNLFKNSWKRLIKNMSYEEFIELKNQIEYLRSLIITIPYKRFLHELGYRVSFLCSDVLIS